jgi:hypothetical protein
VFSLFPVLQSTLRRRRGDLSFRERNQFGPEI